jgi:hypothetical protein
MQNGSTYGTYTAADIERYLAGKLSPAERHAMEKAALEDPFLADALEGYGYTNSPSADLASIRQRFAAGQKRRRYALMPALRVAAVLLLLAGGTWLVYQTLRTDTPGIARETAPLPGATQTDSGSFAPPSTMQSETDATIALDPTPQQKTETPRAAPVQRNTLMTTDDNDLVVEPTPPATMQQAKEVAAPPARPEESRLGNRMATTSSRELAEEGRKEKAGTGGDSLTGLVIVMKPLPDSTPVAVVGFNARTKVAARKEAHFEELEPAEGWASFNQYLALNLREPSGWKEQEPRGIVELSFDINPSGEPVNIRVERSLCSSCDQEAVRLLKQGPKWKKASRKAKVSIEFRNGAPVND